VKRFVRKLSACNALGHVSGRLAQATDRSGGTVNNVGATDIALLERGRQAEESSVDFGDRPSTGEEDAKRPGSEEYKRT
jgi:hypothetical protein